MHFFFHITCKWHYERRWKPTVISKHIIVYLSGLYVLEFMLENKNNSYKYFEKVFWCKFKIQNVLIYYAIKQIRKLKHDDAYIQAKENYKTYKTEGQQAR